MESSDEVGSTFLRADEVDEAGPEPVTVAEPDSTSRPPLDTVEEQRLGITGAQAQDRNAARPPAKQDPSDNVETRPEPQALDTADPDNPPDSISLSQLKNLVSALPTVEPTPYAFEYEDVSSFEEELEELFGYSWDERQSLLRLKASFAKKWAGFNDLESEEWYDQEGHDWKDAPLQKRTQFLEQLKRGLLDNDFATDPVTPLEAVLYVALGCWYEAASPDDRLSSDEELDSNSTNAKRSNQSCLVGRNHVLFIQQNLSLVVEILGVDTIYKELQRAHADDDPDEEIQTSTGRSRPTSWMGHKSKHRWTSTTLMCLLMDMATREERDASRQGLRSSILRLSPDLLPYLTQLIADMRWDESNALPSKKLLLLYWKTTLVTFGGVSRIRRIKAALRKEQPGFESDSEESIITASPLDYHMFRQEITSKYPAFDPPTPLFPFEPESTSVIPPLQEQSSRGVLPGASAAGPASINGSGSSIIHQPVHIATPAPSPPPSPAGPGGKGIKKQNYQTNQMFPFLYPPLGESSNELGGKGSSELHDLFVNRKWHGSDIPASILEAADIFAKRMRATRAMKQLWNERVRFMKYERGYGTTDDITTTEEEDTNGDVDDLTTLDEDPRQRLQAVETFYQQSLPKLQSMVVVLLKVFLQTVTTLVAQAQFNQSSNPQNGVQSPDGQPPSKAEVNGVAHTNGSKTAGSLLHDLDMTRTQEITAKAVSATLLLLFKWLRLSHVLKAEFLTQLILDSNYIQLMLKLFAQQEPERLVSYRCEKPKLNFLRFCQNYSRTGPKLDLNNEDLIDSEEVPSSAQPTDSSKDGPAPAPKPAPPEVDELGYPTSEVPASPITSYSWRNFFSSINYLRVLQKIVKHKAHRQLLMVQFKYSNILKKTLKVPQPDVRLYTLKIIKGQVPYCHRKWRSSNMRIITAIYLHCKPELRDEWLAGVDVDQEMGEALPLEQALRSLTYWHNLRMYPEAMGQDKEKAQALMEEEQDFFLRELGKMDPVPAGPADVDPLENEDPIETNGIRFEAPLHMEGWS